MTSGESTIHIFIPMNTLYDLFRKILLGYLLVELLERPSNLLNSNQPPVLN